MTTPVAKDATRGSEGGTPTEKTGPITSLMNSVKRKLSNRSPEGKQKNEEVSDQPSNIVSPDCKKQIRSDGDLLACSTPVPQRSSPSAQTKADKKSQPLDTSSNYDTDDEVADNCMDERAARLMTRNRKKGRVGQIKRMLRRRLTPQKPKVQKKNDIDDNTSKVPVSPYKSNIDYYAMFEKIQEDIKSIQLDGNRLGETVQNVQREVTGMRAEMVTKEGIDACLSAIVEGMHDQLINHKVEIDYNRNKIVDMEENLKDVKAAIETCQVVNDEQETRIVDLEKTVVKDLDSFRKELEGFNIRLSQKIPPVPFLPEHPKTIQHTLPPTEKSVTKVSGNENKNVIIEGLYEFPVENVEERAREVFDQIGVQLCEADYNKVQRLGTWSNAREWPPPIKVELLADHKKAKILATKDRLVGSDDYYRVTIKPDEPKQMRVARAKIRQTANRARAEGKSVKQTNDYVIVNGVKYDTTTILAINKAMEGTPNENVNQHTSYPSTNKYAENLCMMDTPKGMAFFTIRCKLSNFYPSSFTFNGRPYETAEHAYQAEKAATVKDFKRLKEILAAPTAKLAKDIGHDVSTNVLWERIKVDRMHAILNAKFRQNSHLADYLCTFKGKTLIEGSWDGFWGAGAHMNSQQLKNGTWTGQNHLGKLLTELMEDLLRERAAQQLNKEVPRPITAAIMPADSQTAHAPVKTGDDMVQTLNRYDCLAEKTGFSHSTHL